MRAAKVLTPALLVLFATSSVARATDRPAYDASYEAVRTNIGPLDVRAPARAVSNSKPSRLSPTRLRLPISTSSIDARRSSPSFVWAGRAAPSLPVGTNDPGKAALFHLDKLAPLYDLPVSATRAAVVKKVHDMGRGGVVVSLGQEVDGVEIFRDRMNLLLRRDLGLVAVGGGLHRAATGVTKVGSRRWIVETNHAIANALGDLYEMPVAPDSVVNVGAAPGGYTRFELAPSFASQTAQYRFSRPARIKKVFFPMPESLVPAYYIELFAGKVNSRATDTYAYVIAADDGRLLHRANLTKFEAYNYRVWAETTGNKRPLDAPVEDFTPHPTGIPDGSYPGFVPPVLVSADGFNTNLNGTGDPWIPPGGTETKGNNVDAYSDHGDPNGFSPGDLRADITAPNTFDRVYDTSKDPLFSTDQTKAAVTQLFYTINWLHDSWYDSGFDEAAGNAQVDNYGRGGMGGDPLLAEAQDGALLGLSDNANMATPADGESPRMQMYLWSGVPSGSVKIDSFAATLVPGFASFGPQSFDISGEVVLAQDANAPSNDICSPIINDVTGKIALIDRGTCSFESKVVEAQKAGAIGVIIANHTAGAPAPDMPGGGVMPPADLPVLSVTFEAGNEIKSALMNGPVNATLSRSTSVRPDGTIDNTVVAHEWGHYIHNRLVFCSTNQCGGEGEGWGDFIALQLFVRENDNLDGVFASTVYAPVAFNDAGFFGDRRYPYSVDMTKNPLTFKHIADGEPLPEGIPTNAWGLNNAEVHNAGEVWASMLFEGYVSLLKESKGASPRYSFDEARRRMQDYVVGGMKLAPADPTYTEQRDAILATALAADEKDATLLAAAFAKRGAGSCAQSPDRNSEDNIGVVESFEVTPALSIVSVTLDDSVDQCDADGALDARETGKLTVELLNTGIVPVSKGELTVQSAAPGVEFLTGSTLNLENIAPLSTFVATFDIRIGGPNMPTVLGFDVKATSPEMCQPEVTEKALFRVNYDNAEFVSATDTFESDIDAWRRRGVYANDVWSKSVDENLNHAWHGEDMGFLTDTRLESPSLEVSATEDLVITFKHRHSFETSPEMEGGPDQYWDGAVIEINEAGTSVWKDITEYADPGYGGVIYNGADNALGGRDGFVSMNPSWPKMDTVKLSLGKALAGKTFKIRFRIASDQYVGDFGWEIDDIAFTGIVGTPFPAPVPSVKVCNAPPIADAGENAGVGSDARVTLDASKSSDPDGDALSFEWSQVSGPQVKIEDADSEMPVFVAPIVKERTKLSFQVAVSDNVDTALDVVDVVVEPQPIVAGGGCNVVLPGQTSRSAATAGALSGLALLLLRRRRQAAKA